MRRGPWRRQAWTTTIVDVDTGKLLDVIEGRSAAAACVWLADRPQEWLDAICWAVLARIDEWVTLRKEIVDSLFENDWSEDLPDIQGLDSHLSSARNSIQDHLTPDDVSGALQELRGVQILDPNRGVPYDHVGEIGDAERSVTNAIALLDRIAARTDLTGPERRAVALERAQLQSAIDGIDALVAD